MAHRFNSKEDFDRFGRFFFQSIFLFLIAAGLSKLNEDTQDYLNGSSNEYTLLPLFLVVLLWIVIIVILFYYIYSKFKFYKKNKAIRIVIWVFGFVLYCGKLDKSYPTKFKLVQRDLNETYAWERFLFEISGL
jgi:hypothetical protein